MSSPRSHPPRSAAAHTTAERRVRARIGTLCQWLTRHPELHLPLKALARRAALSPHHLQRSFRRIVGLSPHQFQQAQRLQALKRALRTGQPVASAIGAAGFGSGSRVYGMVDTALGMTPGVYRRGGAGQAISYAITRTALGRLLIGATDRGICYLQFGASAQALRRALRAEFPAAPIEPMPAAQTGEFAAWAAALRAHLGGSCPTLDLPVDVRGTAFQQSVWRYLQAIPYGQVRSYQQVAVEIGRPRAARAVANACAQNRIALLIPCHRVIRGDGEAGGYRWGVQRKRRLLRAEAVARAAVNCATIDVGTDIDRSERV